MDVVTQDGIAEFKTVTQKIPGWPMRKSRLNRDRSREPSTLATIVYIASYIPISIGIALTFTVLIWVMIFYQGTNRYDGATFNERYLGDASVIAGERVGP